MRFKDITKFVLIFVLLTLVVSVISIVLQGCTRYEAIDIDLVHIEAHAFGTGYDVDKLPVGVADDSRE